MSNNGQAEQVTRVVYGETFNRYSKEEFLAFVEPLRVRLRRNGISEGQFRGKRCLDAGCGGGRASILMAQMGAAEVVSYDFTPRNIETTTRHAQLFGYENVIKPRLGSLVDVPFEDQSFDVVWCNGVLHHTIDPTRTLEEVARVLKVGGALWLYLYGSGGLYWHMVFFLREWLQGTSIDLAIAHLGLTGVPTGRVAEFIDDWYVPILKAYTHADVSAALRELGFPEVQRLMEGTTYDTSRRALLEGEASWMGEGDLRYWVTKGSHTPLGRSSVMLPDVDGRGSHYQDAPQVVQFSRDFEQLAASIARLEDRFPPLQGLARLSVAARLQTHLRDLFSLNTPFDAEAFRAAIEREIGR